MRTITNLSCLAAALAFVFGCADPDGELSDFKDRYKKIQGTAGAGGVGGAGGQDAGTCTVPAVGEIDGDYLFALSAVTGGNKSNKNRPIILLTTVTTKGSGGSLAMDWSLQPLEWADRKTPAGAPLTIGDILIGTDGKFDADPAPLDVAGEANPLSGSPITADITSLAGSVCDLNGFYCGSVAGDVSKPIPLSIKGSTWTMEKIAAGVYPEPPKIDCAQNLALPLPLPPP